MWDTVVVGVHVVPVVLLEQSRRIQRCGLSRWSMRKGYSVKFLLIVRVDDRSDTLSRGKHLNSRYLVIVQRVGLI